MVDKSVLSFFQIFHQSSSGLVIRVMFGYFSSCPIAEVWVGKIAIVTNLPVLLVSSQD